MNVTMNPKEWAALIATIALVNGLGAMFIWHDKVIAISREVMPWLA